MKSAGHVFIRFRDHKEMPFGWGHPPRSMTDLPFGKTLAERKKVMDQGRSGGGSSMSKVTVV